MRLDSPVSDIPGVGVVLNPKFGHLGIRTVEELINYYPKRYDDYSNITKISKLKPGLSTAEVQITSISSRYLRRGLHITEALARDDSGGLRLIWFNQPYREESLHKDTSYYVSGNYALNRQKFSMINPSIELKKSFPLNTARILPRYALTKGLNSRDIRKAVKETLPLIKKQPEILPQEIVDSNKLMSVSQAVELVHFPNDTKDIENSRRRLAFNEVFELMLASYLNKLEYSKDYSQQIKFDEQLAVDFVKKLPFKLTDDQRLAIWQIYKDMNKTGPMNRLIEGDVGSGKTVVAAMAALMVMNENKQVAFMAPTELLARQHAETLNTLLKPLGLDKELSMMIGAMSKESKKAAAKASFIVGTHALISENVEFRDLALAIIDEQHRFGVNQRKALKKKAKFQPHLLTLSATPIPRSLALTMFGEMDISRLEHKPAARQPITTKVINDNQYLKDIPEITKLLEEGNQMYVVCPTIESESSIRIKSLQTVHEECLKNFPKFKVATLHGKMSSVDKDKIMSDFQAHKIDILVATTLIEVGIDVPNANIMVIMSSDNFGLAQLHQLRGRIGRGSKPAYCYLVYESSIKPSKRLQTMETCSDGFKLAEIDLELRGPGAIYGSFQHGTLDLRLAELSDTKLLSDARKAVEYFVSSGLDLLEYKRLAESVQALQKITNLN